MGGSSTDYSDANTGNCSSLRGNICFCGFQATDYIAKTGPNSGRRFLRCPRPKEDTQQCKFFKWLDPPTSDHARTEYMLRMEHELMTKLAVQEAETKKWKLVSGVLAFFLLVALFYLPTRCV